MWRLAAVLAAVAVFVYLAVAGVRWLQPQIANDIRERATTALAQRGLLWADVDVQGRQVVLSGNAPSEEAAQAAADTVKGVFGVATVSNDLVVSDDTRRHRFNREYQLTIHKQGDTLTISGEVPDQATQDLLQRLAKVHYADSAVSTSLKLAQGAPAGWRSATGTVLFNLTQFENVTATLIGDRIRINGEVLDPSYSDAAAGAIKAAVPTAYNVKMDVDVVSPSEVAAENAPADETSATLEPAAGESATEAAEAPATEPETAAAAALAPETEAGTNSGCAAMADVSKEVLHFDFDSAKVRRADAPALARVAGAVKGCEGGKVEVDGYTDATGSELYNQWLSEQRAESAVRGLIRHGVKRDRTLAKGFGQASPVAANDTLAHRKLNRRVTFKPAQ
jgi:OOP family OmpA-OmpF porin